MDSLENFVADVEGARGRYAESRPFVAMVADRLEQLVREPGWLRPEFRQPAAGCYRQHVLHVAADGAYSVVSLVWTPGQFTPIHDHIAWCVVGVYEGEEHEARYGLYERDSSPDRYMALETTGVTNKGHVSTLFPPDEDIHRVLNPGPETAISIHVYGADIGKLGTSINHRFDNLPVLEPSGGRRLDWRGRGAG